MYNNAFSMSTVTLYLGVARDSSWSQFIKKKLANHLWSALIYLEHTLSVDLTYTSTDIANDIQGVPTADISNPKSEISMISKELCIFSNGTVLIS